MNNFEDRDILINDKKSFDDNKIEYFEKLILPNELKSKLPLNNYIKDFISKARTTIKNILNKTDKRILVIVGPCSIHNIEEAKKYALKLKELSNKFEDKIFIVMRTYFEKPRTNIGWKGLINDPDLNESYNVNKGLFLARSLLIHNANIGLPCGYEILDTITPQYICDLISWGAIGARTTESQIHRQIVSGLSFPVGFKNGTNGSIDIASDAIISSKSSHCFMGITNDGHPTICKTRGNNDTHIIMRGSKNAPNYFKENILIVDNTLLKKNLSRNIMIDCSHGNSRKNYKNQLGVLKYIIEQIKQKTDYENVIGLMIESNIKEGKQSLPNNVHNFNEKEIKDNLEYGVSITDCCVNIEETEEMLNMLYDVL
jgi:3-deoxy-7-phosphoheptulonate synthase